MKQYLSVLLVCLSLSIFAQEQPLLLLHTNSKSPKVLPAGTILEIFQEAGNETIPFPHLYYGNLLAVTKDSLKIALLEIPKVKTRFSNYTKDIPQSTYPLVQSIPLQSIDMIKHTSNFKRGPGGKILRMMAFAGIGYFTLVTIGSVALLDTRPDLGKGLLLFSTIGLGASIGINKLCKPKKYKLRNPEKGAAWFIMTP